MAITDRMLIGAIASNPGIYDGAGQARYCFQCQLIYFASAKQPAPEHDSHPSFDLPALNADGSAKLVTAFKRFIKRWSPERQDEIERFGMRKGWELAMELHYGGGALKDEEAAEWKVIVDGRLNQLVIEARKQIEAGPGSPPQGAGNE
ncbi:MAG TPA: hypothetical protein VGE07_19910 [Herpetosiphonaceae bacterium]